ncbi:MAG: hypothetical protein AAF402_12300 [Pseudomonadota bacterium]
MPTDNESKNIKNLSSDKRNILKKSLQSGLAIGAVTAGNWTAPVMKTVVLPVHASTTGTGGEDTAGDPAPRTFFGSPGIGIREDPTTERSTSDSAVLALLSVVAPSAHAQPATTALCVEVTGEMCSVTLQGVFFSGLVNNYAGEGAIGDPIPLTGACIGQMPFEIVIFEPSGNTVGFLFTGAPQVSGFIPEAACALEPINCTE